MIAFWVTLRDEDGPMHGVCVEAKDETQARQIVKDLGVLISMSSNFEIDKVETLPYPANPRLTKSDTPTFCYTPSKCAGRGSCPNDPACTE